jgi:hypothetical protein
MKAFIAAVRDLTGLAAIGAISYGFWLIYQPLGFIAAGALVLWVVLAAAKGSARAEG